MFESYKNRILKNRITEMFFEGENYLTALYYITRRDLTIKKEYDFSSMIERDYVEKILQCFKDDTINDFWNNRLYLNCKLLRLNNYEYFTYLLWCFLISNQFDKNYIFYRKLKIDMYDEELVWFNNNGCKDYVYTLTDFSVTYYKMYLGCVLFIQSNKNLLKIISPAVIEMELQNIYDALNNRKIDVIKR